ncbi:hypothetical protein OG429_02390 [Streptomyces sp. NBC_00190]|uniref:DUF6879 family protein n=1 Tax=unclassified Streptomyces TaxID=2593676 RepID=UPI002E2845BE|nr:DUF6879 family protein [Streptomyces sp. NBC_00190]WSZ38267.1 hypothetical protein OG239_05385 [Streptomyces sp. NBC_00868]
MPQSDVPGFDVLLDGAQHSAVHLEMRDGYGVAAESAGFAHWLATGVRDIDPDSEYWAFWTSLVRRTVARGVTVRRARIVSEPLSDYSRYSHAGAVVNIAAGEEIRYLPRRHASDIALPGNDFWLVDGRLIRWNHFTGTGASAGGEMSEDPAVAALCTSAFTAVWERAVPYEDFKPRPIR